MAKNRNWRIVATLGLLLWQSTARAGDVGITYVKTIGQPSPQMAMVTGGGRLSVDEKGNVYAGTPGQNSFLQKISPTGRVLWRADDTHNAYLGTALDDEYVYGSGIGYYGYRHLLRRKKTSGVVPPGWNFVWKTPEEVVSGVRGFVNPGALLVDGDFLYVLDIGNGELRRLDKRSGVEKPFANPIKIDGALDVAFSQAGDLLVLANAKPVEGAPADTPANPTPGFVVALNHETGAVKTAKFIEGLGASAAIAVQPKTGAILIGEGGPSAEGVNKVRIFDAAGKDSGKTIGRGGEWQGMWSVDSFNFASGMADIAFDPKGGFWANAYGGRMRALSLLTHFSPDYKSDKVLLAATGDDILADDDLNIIVGGNYKMNWNGDLIWTSGLIGTGAPNKYPTTIDYWTYRPAYTDGDQTLVVNIHAPSIYALDAKTGVSSGKSLALPGTSAGVAHAGKTIFVMVADKIYRTSPDLAPLEEVLTVPEEIAKLKPAGLATNEDGSVFYFAAGAGAEARVYAFKDGQKLWEAKGGAVVAQHKGVLLVANPTGAGVLILEAKSGATLGVFGQSALNDRPIISGITGASFGSKDGADYLFIAAQSRILVYRMVVAG